MVTAVNISIDDLELAAAPGRRAFEEDRLGDWLLRAAGGFTGRANSALAAGDPGLPLRAAILKVRRWYSERGLPAMIAVAYPTGRPAASALDRTLGGLGWAIRSDAATVMTAEASQVAARAQATAAAVQIAAEASARPQPEADARRQTATSPRFPAGKRLIPGGKAQEIVGMC